MASTQEPNKIAPHSLPNPTVKQNGVDFRAIFVFQRDEENRGRYQIQKKFFAKLIGIANLFILANKDIWGYIRCSLKGQYGIARDLLSFCVNYAKIIKVHSLINKKSLNKRIIISDFLVIFPK